MRYEGNFIYNLNAKEQEITITGYVDEYITEE
jgi:hypothetical protein